MERFWGKKQEVSTTYEDIIAAMEADTSISKEIKEKMTGHVMNGRWFSSAQDEYYKNESLWSDVE